MDLLLHIGTEKTGTQSVQVALWSNRASLRKGGVLYPESLGRPNHKQLAAAMQNPGGIGDLPRLYGLTDPARADSFRNAVRDKLAAEFGAAACDRVVLSTEHLSSRLVSDEEVRRLFDFLKPFFRRIAVLVYLRRQDEFLLSTYSTDVKSGSTRSLYVPKGAGVERYDHWALLSRWANVFGRDAIICRKYVRDLLRNGNIIDDFLDAAGIDAAFAPRRPPHGGNRSLDAETCEFLRLLNVLMTQPQYADIEDRRPSIIRALEAISDGPQLSLAETDLCDFMGKFRESNRKVAEAYFGGTVADSDDPLFPRAGGGRARVTAPMLTADAAVRIAAYLIPRTHPRREEP